MDLFGSALPENKDRAPHSLVVTRTDEYEFGWVFFYNTREHSQTGDHQYALAGNAPLIFDRADGKLYVTGTAHPTEHYIAQFRAGVRHPA